LDENLGCNIELREAPLMMGRVKIQRTNKRSPSQSNLESSHTEIKEKNEQKKKLIKPSLARIRLGDDSPQAYGLNLDTPKNQSKGDI
jgi:hypothetical protein